MLPTIIKKNLQQIQEIIQANNISYLALYGSYSRDEQKPGSDLDLLVSLDKTLGLFEMIGVEQKFSEVLGIKVDLVTKHGLSKYIKPYIQDDIKVIYAKKS